MKICAVIAEFNPFHNGHRFLIEQIKQKGFTHIVAIMSGNFVQRGEPAIVSKSTRTKMALASGIDLVIEIPAIWSIATAEIFASAGVFLAHSLGIADVLAFGVEHDNLDILYTIENKLRCEDFKENFKKYIQTGITFAKARELALGSCINEFNAANYLKHPNNILAVEYLKALKNLNSKIKPMPILRSDVSANGNIYPCCSASEIREMIIDKNKEYINYMHEIPAKILCSESHHTLYNAEQAILYRFKTLKQNEITALPDVSEGLEHKIIKSAANSNTLHDFLFSIKSKRYTMSRIKRIILSGFLEITNEFQNKSVPYIRVLGFNTKGTEILKKAKLYSCLPVVSTYKEIKKLSENAIKVFETECRADELYGFFATKLDSRKKEQFFKIIKGDAFDF